MSKTSRDFPDIPSLLEGGFTEETARLLYAQGEEIAIFVTFPSVPVTFRHDFENLYLSVNVLDQYSLA